MTLLFETLAGSLLFPSLRFAGLMPEVAIQCKPPTSRAQRPGWGAECVLSNCKGGCLAADLLGRCQICSPVVLPSVLKNKSRRATLKRKLQELLSLGFRSPVRQCLGCVGALSEAAADAMAAACGGGRPRDA